MIAACHAQRQRRGSYLLARAVSCALVVLLASSAGRASAEILAFDCTSDGKLLLNVWVDLDRSSDTVQGTKGPNLPLRT